MTSPAINPYESPRSELSDEMPELYAIDNRRLTVGETWRIMKNPLVFGLALLYKLLGIRSRPVFAFSPELRLIERDALPEHIRASTDERMRQALAAGFLWQFTYYSPSVGCGASLGHALLSHDGRVALVISQARTWVGQTVREELATALFSRLSETEYLVTTTAPFRLETPERTTEYHPRFTLAQLGQRHAQRLAESGKEALAWHSDAELEESIRARERKIIEHYKQRKLCVLVTPAEYRDLLQVARNGGPVTIPKPIALQALEWLLCVMVGAGLILLWQPRPPGSGLGVLGWSLIAVGILSLIAVGVIYGRRQSS